MDADAGKQMPPTPQIFLLIENPAKNTNLGPILRCACAFGIKTVVAVGYAQCSVAGSHGASKYVEIIPFPTANQAAGFLRDTCEVASIVGSLGCCPGGFGSSERVVKVQVLPRNEGDGNSLLYPMVEQQLREDSGGMTGDSANSNPFYDHNFRGNSCLAFSRCREGISSALAEVCDAFVHVPHERIIHQPQPTHIVPTCLLDVQSTLSIILAHVTCALGCTVHTSDGHKFEVVKKQAGPSDADETVRLARQQERERRWQEHDELLSTGLFSVDSALGDY